MLFSQVFMHNRVMTRPLMEAVQAYLLHDTVMVPAIP